MVELTRGGKVTEIRFFSFICVFSVKVDVVVAKARRSFAGHRRWETYKRRPSSKRATASVSRSGCRPESPAGEVE